MFLIASGVRGPGSCIAHHQVRVAFGELLAGYLSWLSIPLLGLGLSVGMIRSWRQGVLGVCEGGWADGEVINVDASGGPPPLLPPAIRNNTWGKGRMSLPAARAPPAGHDSSP